MSTAAATKSRWTRATVATGIVALVAWQALVFLDGPTDAALLVAVFGFVLHVLLGKGYALVPPYFARSLTPARAPMVGLPLTAGGTALLAGWRGLGLPHAVGLVGAVSWLTGVCVFAGALAWTVRDNPTGAETGTGDHNAHRRAVDRYANPFVLVAVGYLLVGSVDLVGVVGGFDTLIASRLAGVAHLLAAGSAVLALLAVGVRLLPRFLVASPPSAVVYVMLPAAALGPGLIASSLGAGPRFVAGAVLEAVGVGGFAVAVLVTLHRADRRRVAFAGVTLGVVSGVAGVLVGLSFALLSLDPTLAVVHRRLNLVGLLGLAIVGVSFQFYPPAVGRSRLASDRSAAAAIALLACGLVVEVVGLLVAVGWLVGLGRLAVLGGAVLAAVVLFDAFRVTGG
ncbi:hypothetical protein [Salinigranum salinum]|uniref:hypothetical protein n=1 Tax=Salinigranum salinum TaxID=1364937 RepID=UPI0012608900|nr:hypothetical protein [Salinigranum salinum]